MVCFQCSSQSGPIVYFWYRSWDWLVSIRLLSPRPSTSLYHSIAFLHIVLKCLLPTGHSWCQSRVTLYRGDDGRCHSLSLWLAIKASWYNYISQQEGTSSTYNLLSLAAWGFQPWNSLSSFLSSKFSYGSSVQSVSSGYHVHLTRYKTFFHSLLNWLPTIFSTSYPVWYSYPSTLYLN